MGMTVISQQTDLSAETDDTILFFPCITILIDPFLLLMRTVEYSFQDPISGTSISALRMSFVKVSKYLTLFGSSVLSDIKPNILTAETSNSQQNSMKIKSFNEALRFFTQKSFEHKCEEVRNGIKFTVKPDISVCEFNAVPYIFIGVFFNK